MPAPQWIERVRQGAIRSIGVLLCVFTLSEVNYPLLSPHSQLAIFAMLGLVLCFLHFPLHARLAEKLALRWLDFSLAALTVLCCGYVVVHTEPVFASLWVNGMSLGNRARAHRTGLRFSVGERYVARQSSRGGDES